MNEQHPVPVEPQAWPPATSTSTTPVTWAGMKERAPSTIAVLVGLLAVFWLIGHFAAGGHGHFDWDAASAAATAYGTLALAFVTSQLVAQTRTDASGTRDLARLAAQDQWARSRAEQREKIERVATSVQEVRDAAIVLRAVRGVAAATPRGNAIEESAFNVAISRLKVAITLSGHPVNDFGSADLLSRTTAEKSDELNAEGQGQAALYEVEALLGAFDRETEDGRPQYRTALARAWPAPLD